MSGPIYFNGTVDLKPDTTIREVLNLYWENGCPWDDDEDLTDVVSDYDDYDCAVRLVVEGDQLQYTVDMGDGSYDFCDAFEGFLKGIAEQLAAKGWISWEGEAGDDQQQVAYGPTELDKLRAVAEQAGIELEAAQTKYKTALEALTSATPASQ